MHLLRTIGDKGLLFMLRRNVVAEVQGIRLVSFVANSRFAATITQSLELICEHDQRRFRRVRKHIEWIYDQARSRGARWGRYFPRIRACQLDFEFDPEVGDTLTHAAGYASLIVHEATHGVVYAHQIQISDENRDRIERLCYAEQNRFLAGLKRRYPELEKSLTGKYDAARYGDFVSGSRWQDLAAAARRAVRREMPHGGADGRQPRSSEPDQTSAAAGSRRSP